MKKTLFFTYGLLIILTITTALISNVMAVSKVAIAFIMVLSVLKFFLVSFEFMELKKANSFWKGSLISVLGLIILSILFIRITS
ncbi:cytochrome C oxidase subunit IV family protein [Flavobacterium lacustre]|uniref:cytochrome C oxidase subunit IV family protein n=1 Tax=Flavobacterium lacustre TaxID=3016339 RepID=UPI0022B6D385|nr:cytochrome C oxidase subunit IV family protein [Flavobacterium lacustre]